MLELDFLVTFRFQSVIFDGFVVVIEGYTVTFCPGGAENIFFGRIVLLDIFRESLLVFSYGQIN